MSRRRTLGKGLALLTGATLLLSMLASTTSAMFGQAVINPIESNIAAKFWVTATADSGNALADLATDETLDTTWIAEDPGAGHRLELDLGGEYDNLRKAEVVFADINAVYRYRLDASTDGSTWDLVADRTSHERTAQGFVDLFTRPSTRYVRLTITGSSPGAVVGIRELKVFNYLRGDIVNGADMSGGLDSPQTNGRAHFLNPNPSLQEMGPGPEELDLVKDRGMELVRLRIWNEPRSENSGNLTIPPYQGPDRSAVLAQQIKQRGLQLGIDFHYADSWADPSKQPKPQAWAALPFDELVTTMHDFTFDYVKDLVDQGTTPDKVAVGNEIINGFLYGSEAGEIGTTNPPYFRNNPGLYLSQPGGGLLWRYWGSSDPIEQQKYNDAWDRFTTLVAAGIKAVREASPETKVEIHAIVDTGRLDKTMEFWSQLLARVNDKGADPDVIAISYYPQWHGTLDDLDRYLYTMMSTFPSYYTEIAETSYPASGGAIPNATEPRTVQGQANQIQHVIQAANDVIDNKGLGVLMWEPQTWQTMFRAVQGMPPAPAPYTSWSQPHASIDVFNKSFAKHVIENRIYVTTVQGTAPTLPDTVNVLTMSDGSIDLAPVSWADVDPVQYESHGNFTVVGSTEFGEVTADVSVIFDFTGFGPPLASLPSTQSVNAGSAVPVKFSLGGDQGLVVIADGYPTSQAIDCDTHGPIGSLEPTSASEPFAYDPASDAYKYTWKSAKSWAGTCRQLIVQLVDGTENRAHLQFVK